MYFSLGTCQNSSLLRYYIFDNVIISTKMLETKEGEGTCYHEPRSYACSLVSRSILRVGSLERLSLIGHYLFYSFLLLLVNYVFSVP